MNIKYVIVIVIVIFGFIISCELKTNSENELKTNRENAKVKSPFIEGNYSYNVKEDFTKHDFFTPYLFAEIYKFIPLETIENNLFGDVGDIKFYDGKILVNDHRNTKTINIFNFSGNHIGTISSLGKGAGEYFKISGFFCKDDHVYIYDDQLGKIIWFDLLGNFIGERLVGFLGSEMEFIGEDRLAFITSGHSTKYNEDRKYCLVVTDFEGNFVYKSIENKASISKIGNGKLGSEFFRIENSLYCAPPFYTELFEITEDSVVSKLNFIFESHMMDDHWFLSEEKIDELFHKNIITSMNKICIVGDYMYFTAGLGRDMYSAMLDLNEKRIISIGNKIVDVAELDYVSFMPITVYDDYFVTIVDAYVLTELRDREFFADSKLVKDLGERAYKINANDNPIIVFFKMKSKDEINKLF